MAVAQHKAGGLHHLTADLFKGSWAEVRHVDGVPQQQFRPQLFKAGQEHPCVLGDHRLIAVFGRHLPAPLDEYGEQVTLAVGIVLLYKLAELGAHIGTAHVGRIGHNHIILPLHRLCNVDEGQQLLRRHFQTRAVH